MVSSRLINKLIYFSYGTKDVLERECQNLNHKLDLYLDDKKIDLPDIGLQYITIRHLIQQKYPLLVTLVGTLRQQ